MKALVLKRPGEWESIDAPEPGDPGTGQALVRVHRVGVCGTDLHAYHGRQPFFSYPRILGHELGVEILDAGPNERGLKPGDRCAVEPYLDCGQCQACRLGKPNCCVNLQVLGVHRDGGLQERMLIPLAKLHRANRLGYEELALVETLAVGAHAVGRARLAAQERVLVIGAGPIGLSVIQSARAEGARVWAADVNPRRLEFCRQRWSIEGAIDPRAGNLADALRHAWGGELPTAVFDATGNPKSMMGAFDCPAPGGRLVFVGLFPGEVTFQDPHFHRRELTLLASRNALATDFARVLALIEAGAVDTSPWITHSAQLQDVPAEFAGWAGPESGVLKAMIAVT